MNVRVDTTALSHRTALASGAKWTCTSARMAGIIARSANVHAESLSVRTRVRRTRTTWTAHTLHVCALSRTREHSRVYMRARGSLFPSVSEDQRPWPRDHERLIHYISAKVIRYFIHFPHNSRLVAFFVHIIKNVLWVERSDEKIGLRKLLKGHYDCLANYLE